MGRLRRLLEPETAQDVVEYALLAALISIVAIGIILLIGPYLQTLWQDVVNGLQTGEQGAFVVHWPPEV